jgi:protein-tyrosine-phosphatase
MLTTAVRRWRWGRRRITAGSRALFTRLLWRRLTRRAVVPALAEPVSRVIFVCHGNIMRSAFAQAYWQQRIHAPATRPLAVASAGSSARAGRAAHADAIAAADSLGLSLAAHSATPLAQLVPQSGDLFVAFDCENEADLLRATATVPGAHVLLLGDLEFPGTLHAEITDPWGKGPDTTRRTFERIVRLLQQLAARIGATTAATSSPSAGPEAP